MQPRHVLLASMALAALAFFGWRALGPDPRPRRAPSEVGAAAVRPRGAEPAPEREAEIMSPPRGALEVGASRSSEASPPGAETLGVLVYGAVLDDAGARVAQGELTFRPAAGEKRSGRIDVPGSYTALGLASGRWSLRVAAPGHYPFEDELEIPVGAERHRHDVALERAVTLRVRFVTPDGTPLAEVSEAIRRDDDLRPSAIASVDPPPARLPDVSGRSAFGYGVGRWKGHARWDRDDSIPAGFDGLLVLQQAPPVQVSAVLRDVVLATQLVGPGVDEVEFTLAPAELDAQLAGLRLTVVDAVSGAPLTEGRVGLSHSQRSGGGRPLGEDGTIEFEGELPGLMELNPYVPEYERVKKRVRLLPGETIDFTLALHPLVTVTGRVLGPDGAGVSVSMTTVPLHQVSMPLDLETRSSFMSDNEGRFETQLGANEAMVVVTERGQAVVPRFVDARAAVGELELRAGPGTPITLRSSGDDTLRAVIADASGRPFHTLRVRGEAELRLMPGPYRLRAGGDEASWHDEAFTVGSEPLTLSFPGAPR